MKKLQKIFAILPLVIATMSAPALADTSQTSKEQSFVFSTQVNRIVDKDLMQVGLYSHKSGKNLTELNKEVSVELNKFLEVAKAHPAIEISADGVSNSPNYDNKNRVNGWVTEGRITLKSKDFEAMAKVLDNLGEKIAISYIDFSVSPETMAMLEDEMTLDIIKQFQHKAEVIQKGINAKSYILRNVQLNTPNGESAPSAFRAKSAFATSMNKSYENLPLEAGKETISASATGTVIFDQE